MKGNGVAPPQSEIEEEKRRYFQPWLHYSLMGAAYFAQGANLIFGQSFEASYLKDNGIDESTIGLINGLSRIPFAIKIVFAMVSDRYPLCGWGRRIPYFIIGSLTSTATWFPMAYVAPQSQLPLYVTMRLIQISGAAMAEVSCDALVSEIVPCERMSFAQSLMEGTRSVALLVSGLSFGFLGNLGSYQYVALFAIISGLCFFPTFFAIPAGAKEGQRHHFQKKKHGLKCSDFKRLLTPYAILLMWLLFTNAFATASKVLSVQLYCKDDLNFPSKKLGYYATAGNVGSLVGSFLYGWISHRHAAGQMNWVSRYQLDKFNLILACFGQAGLMLALISKQEDWIAYICGFALQFFWSGWMIYSRALVLNYCPPGIAGSFAAVMFAAPNAGQVTGPMTAGAISQSMGPSVTCVITAILFCIPGICSFFYPKPPEIGILEKQVSTITETDVDVETPDADYEKLDDDVIIQPAPEVGRVGINTLVPGKKTRAVNSKSRG